MIDQSPTTVAVIVVTHNRLELLRECLAAIAGGVRRADEVIVIDSDSTDGTAEWLGQQSGLTVVRQENSGSAGGFHRGILEAYRRGHDWFWCMDDDVIVETTSLQRLLEASEIVGPAVFLSSVVRFPGGASANVPYVDARAQGGAYPNWEQHLARGIVKIQYGTFVSILISRAAVAKHGLPLKEFFIWGDDTEYTRRLTSNGAGYLVGDSAVLHLRASPVPLELRRESNPERIGLYTNYVRNHLYLARTANKGFFKRARVIGRYALGAGALLRAPDYRLRRLRTFAAGFWKGLWFSPRVDYVDRGDSV